MAAERQLKVETLLRASRFNIERVTRALPDGATISREIIRHPGAVVIVPVLADGRVCLIKNYRVAVDRELVELPAGTLEPNEPPIVTAHRELIEETGYRAAAMEPLCEMAMSPGILDERMYAFIARDLVAGAPAREVGEEIENILVTHAELDSLLRNNSIQDAKTIAALLYYMRYFAAE